MNTATKPQLVEPKRLFLVHYTHVYAMKIDRLLVVEEILYSREPFRIGKEIIVQYLYPLTRRVEVHRLYGMYLALFVMHEAERAPPDATARKELDRERVLRI